MLVLLVALAAFPSMCPCAVEGCALWAGFLSVVGTGAGPGFEPAHRYCSNESDCSRNGEEDMPHVDPRLNPNTHAELW